ncbi:uncharacterized protein LOC135225343 [Macrobrachium nipponense]|uniref:uncharacterized protein LOC135225343 n=1 Tax=Macrobrachium nipponense TaxID=159736 RepID=UPI0030C7EE4F
MNKFHVKDVDIVLANDVAFRSKNCPILMNPEIAVVTRSRANVGNAAESTTDVDLMSLSTNVSDPKSIITEDHVKKALIANKGIQAVLKSWKVADFTKRGDNYACEVTSVEVKYSLNDKEECEVTYVVKLNPHRNFGDFQEVAPFFFEKEGKFYEELVPALNEALMSAGQKPLPFAKCFLVSLEEGKEQLYFEDLRARGFKMFDRRKGMDKYHVALVISELARLHGASYLLTKKVLKGESAGGRYEFITKDLLDFTPNTKELFLSWIERGVDTGEYKVQDSTAYAMGDCWNNNLLFRYNAEGRPMEVMLLDLQLCREASAASDLNYLLCTSVNGDVRKPNLRHFLSLYHSTYKEVLEGGDMPMHFTIEELVEEYRDKNKFGLLFALVIIPMMLTEPEEVPEMSDTDIETLMNDFRAIALDKLKTNPCLNLASCQFLTSLWKQASSHDFYYRPDSIPSMNDPRKIWRAKSV